MNQPAKSHEPSMEEILASIRRIIADDDAKTPQPAAFAEPPPAPSPVVAAAPAPMPAMAPSPVEFLSEIPAAAPPPPAPAPEMPQEAPDILDLTEDMRAPEPVPSAPSFTTIDAHADVVFADSLPPRVEPEPEPEMPAFAMQDETPAYDPLEAARQTLAEQVEMDRPLLSRSATAAVDSAFASLTHTVLSQNARTLDDLVKDMLRPMLKSWLDDNLPSLVERLVRAEIERVSRGR
jgi:cell pole-organizing protein PopZ